MESQLSSRHDTTERASSASDKPLQPNKPTFLLRVFVTACPAAFALVSLFVGAMAKRKISASHETIVARTDWSSTTRPTAMALPPSSPAMESLTGSATKARLLNGRSSHVPLRTSRVLLTSDVVSSVFGRAARL